MLIMLIKEFKMKKVIVYSTSGCPWCIKLKKFLKKHKISFIDKNVTDSSEYAEEMIKKSGQTGVPVIDINGHIVIGFNEEKVKSLLHIK